MLEVVAGNTSSPIFLLTEFANKRCRRGVWSPFSVNYALIVGVDIQAVSVIPLGALLELPDATDAVLPYLGKIVHSAFILFNLTLPLLRFGVSPFQRFAKR